VHENSEKSEKSEKRMRMPGFEPGISPPQGEVLTTILHTPGEAGYRSQYLSHAKRALYHLSYIPIQNLTHRQPKLFAQKQLRKHTPPTYNIRYTPHVACNKLQGTQCITKITNLHTAPQAYVCMLHRGSC